MREKQSARLNAITRQVQRLANRLTKMEAQRRRFSWYRLGIFLSGSFITILTLVWFNDTVAWSVAGITLVVFNIIAHFHRRLDRSVKRHQIWSELKTTQIARMNLDWRAIPPAPLRAQQVEIPFENDLDITGERSLHRLINTAVSDEGSYLLADWLRPRTPDLASIRKRQNIVAELAPLTRFRNRLLLTFRLISRDNLEGRKLTDWLAGAAPSGVIRKLLPVTSALIFINIILFLLNQWTSLPAIWLFSLFIYLIIYFSNSRTLHQFFDSIFHLDEELGKFKGILRYLETYPFGKNRHLIEMCQPFLQPGAAPSKQLRKIKWLSAAIGLRMNPMMAALLNLVFPWDFFFACLIQRSRETVAKLLPTWLNAWFELEALISLADFAYLHPDDVFPELTDSAGPDAPPVFHAEKMGHPLIPPRHKVCNDYALNNLGEIDIITGSNMAGKSTFLKSAGVNLCLAYAGGPVDARRFRSGLFRIFTCIKINDSITDGFSFFYAEVKRLKSILQALEERDSAPVFFLIDEIFKGTNNRERLIGSRSYVARVVGQRGVGLIATHDLELAKLADQFSSIHNHHFREEVLQGKMVFDYLLRPGPCPTTNALKIMQMEGLPVDY
ncbi:MAG: MutS-related protein [Candidatus Zhuqueibacterota bacterium]